MVACKRLEALAQIHQRSFEVCHLFAEVIVVVIGIKGFPAFAFDHEFVAQNQMPLIVDALERQEKQVAVFLHMFLGHWRMIVVQNGRKQLLLEEFDLVLVKIQFAEPSFVVFVQFVE